MTFYNMLSTLLNTAGSKAKRKDWKDSFITRDYNMKTRKVNIMLHMKYSFHNGYVKTLYMPLNEDLTAEDWDIERDN